MGLTRLHGGDGRVSQKMPIPQQQQIRLQEAQQEGHHGELRRAQRLDQPFPEDVAAGLTEGQHAHLRKGTGRATTAGTPEGARVVGGIGHIQHKPIDSHRAHAAVEGAGRLGATEQRHDLGGQRAQRRDAQPLARFAQRRASRYAAWTKDLQPAKDLAIGIATKQPEGNHEPHHEPPR
jgi:hypothetical protein